MVPVARNRTYGAVAAALTPGAFNADPSVTVLFVASLKNTPVERDCVGLFEFGLAVARTRWRSPAACFAAGTPAYVNGPGPGVPVMNRGAAALAPPNPDVK